MNHPGSVSNASLLTAFLIGVILLVAFGRDWLAIRSVPVFLAGLLGIAVAVLAFGIANRRRNSRHK